MTRDEAFETWSGIISRLQRERVLSFEQVTELNHAIVRYGSACSAEGSAMTRESMRPVVAGARGA